MSVGAPAYLHLEVFAAVVAEAFGEHPYQVGSSVRGKEWRDVDVRLILDDDVFAALFPDRASKALATSKKWSATCMAWSALGEKMTGLPIDFQIQPMTEANEMYDGPRNALGLAGSFHRIAPRAEEPEGPQPERVQLKVDLYDAAAGVYDVVEWNDRFPVILSPEDEESRIQLPDALWEWPTGAPEETP